MGSLLYLLLFMGPFTGGMLALFSAYRDDQKLKIFLSFAGGYLFSITVLHLMPEAYSVDHPLTGLLVLAGFLFQVFLENFSEGIEHGHIHLHKHLKNHVVPLGIMLSMGLHTFMEGIPLGGLFVSDAKIQYSLLAGIILHEFPAAFALMSILLGIEIERKRLLVILVMYALMAPAGAFLSNYASLNIPESVFKASMAFVIGTFLHISTTILFESTEHHQLGRRKTYAVIAGILVALLATYV